MKNAHKFVSMFLAIFCKVQTVILRCLTSLIYSKLFLTPLGNEFGFLTCFCHLRRTYQAPRSFQQSPPKGLGLCPLQDWRRASDHFFEVQTVILRCLTSLIYSKLFLTPLGNEFGFLTCFCHLRRTYQAPRSFQQSPPKGLGLCPLQDWRRASHPSSIGSSTL